MSSGFNCLPACPDALGRALCPTTFLVLVIIIGEPQTETQVHLPDTCVDH